MNIFLKPETIAYTWPADGSMNIGFIESEEKGFTGDVLSVQVDRDQAHSLIRELWDFCRRAGHPLYQHDYEIKKGKAVCGYCGIHMLLPDQKNNGKCPACAEKDRIEAQKAD